MIKNFDVPAELTNGQQITNNGKSVLIKDIIEQLLSGNYDDERNLSGAIKFQRGLLGAKVAKGGDIEFTIEELAIIKEIVGKGGTVPVVLQVWKILETESYVPTES